MENVHNSHILVDFFESVFREHLIARGLCSSDLHLIYFMGIFKEEGNLYSNHPHTQKELQVNIQRTVGSTSYEMFKKASNNTNLRLDVRLNQNGQNVEQMYAIKLLISIHSSRITFLYELST